MPEKQPYINPIHQVVKTVIKPDRIEEYRELMRADIIGSREEPGCIRFDMLQELGSTNKFIIYETYANEEALNHHLNTSHFKAVRDFLDSGGGASDIAVTGASSVFLDTVGGFQRSRRAENDDLANSLLNDYKRVTAVDRRLTKLTQKSP